MRILGKRAGREMACCLACSDEKIVNALKLHRGLKIHHLQQKILSKDLTAGGGIINVKGVTKFFHGSKIMVNRKTPRKSIATSLF